MINCFWGKPTVANERIISFVLCFYDSRVATTSFSFVWSISSGSFLKKMTRDLLNAIKFFCEKMTKRDA
ncbi:MAG: hypothetical protein LBQ66_02725 [Planctomycetaceae bacterium]|nr:hypothetical protein [Planctomycetaceae bacterium]